MQIKQLVEKTLDTLEENQGEWAPQWNSWADEVINNQDGIKQARRLFREHPPLRFYLPIGEAKKYVTKCNFSIRYYGKDIAQISAPFAEGGVPHLFFNDKNKENNHRKQNRNKLGLLTNSTEPFEHPWDSQPSKAFRNELKNIIPPEIDEHILESLLLDEMEKNSADDKFLGTLRNLQPVRLFEKLRFQMKIPFSASDGTPKYSKTGGGIDILARIGSHQDSNLTVLELKKADKVAYKKAQSQSIIYAIGLLKLLKNQTMGNKWWDLFGYKRVLPNKLKIYAGVVIPESIKDAHQNEIKSLGISPEETIQIGEDQVKCGYIYFENTPDQRIWITETCGLKGVIFDPQ